MSSINLRFPLRRIKADGPAEPPRAEGRSDQLAETGRLFRQLLGESQFLSLFWDGESFALHRTDRQGRRTTHVHEDPAALLRVALGVKDLRECRNCGQEKPLTDFYASSHHALGRDWVCKPCAIKRVRAARRRDVSE